MEEAPDGKSSNSDSKSSSMRAIIMKGLEYARNVKVVVAIFVVLVSCCLLLYYSSNNNNNYNFGQLLSFSSPFHSLNATPADPPPNEPVHDEFYELRKALNAAATEDKTVILTTLNDAWAEPNNIFDIFLESFRIGNNTARLLNHLLVIAVDDKAYLRCQALVRHCYFFKSNHSKELAHEARFMTPIYLEMMWERLDFLRIILTLGYNFVFTVHDEYYELRKALKAAARDDNTVILAILNEAWAEPNSIFDVFLESFRIGDDIARLLNHLLVIAVDDKAYLRCQALVRHCYFFKSNRSTELAHEATFMTPTYLEIIWERLDFLRTILTLGYNFVLTDTDVVWFRDPFPHFYSDIDFQTSCDAFNGNPADLKNFPNIGFKFVRSNNRTIEFYKLWVSSRWKYPCRHEQNVFNKIKRRSYVKKIGVSFRFLDTDYFGGFCTPSKDFNKVCTMHANCCKGLGKKIADLNATLEDWKMYVNVSSTTNQTIETHWRAPNRCRIWD